MAQHKSFTVDTEVKVYFCDPQSPWQARLELKTLTDCCASTSLKRTDLSVYSQEDLDKVALLLNQRPRKTLGFQTPADKLQAKCCIDPLRPPERYQDLAHRFAGKTSR